MAYIFVADENALVLDLISTFLSEDNHQLLSVQSAEALVSLTKERDQKPDLVILSADLEPGFLAELLFELREKLEVANLPFLILVPPGAVDVEMDLQGIPAVELVHKPFDRGTFLARVRAVLLMMGSPISTGSTGENSMKEEGFTNSVVSTIHQRNPESDGESLSTQDQFQVALTEQIQAWLAEEGRMIMEHETRQMLHESYAEVVENVVWKVVPEMAEEMLRAEILKLTKELEN